MTASALRPSCTRLQLRNGKRSAATPLLSGKPRPRVQAPRTRATTNHAQLIWRKASEVVRGGQPEDQATIAVEADPFAIELEDKPIVLHPTLGAPDDAKLEALAAQARRSVDAIVNAARRVARMGQSDGGSSSAALHGPVVLAFRIVGMDVYGDSAVSKDDHHEGQPPLDSAEEVPPELLAAYRLHAEPHPSLGTPDNAKLDAFAAEASRCVGEVMRRAGDKPVQHVTPATISFRLPSEIPIDE